MRVKLVVAAVAAIGLMGAAEAPKTAPAPAPTGPQPYLTQDALDTYKVLPPAPTPGTTRYEADRTIYLQNRKLEGSARWKMAQGDDNSFGIIKGMTCALGAELTPQNAPKTYAMFSRVGRDASRVTNYPKDIYKRQRPYLIDEGDICVTKSEGLAKSPDYPSGHNTWGWSVGLLLAELAPDRASEVMARARAFGESRMVCGVHNMSAVHMGWANGSMLVAALHGNEAFRKDLEVVRKEIATVRKTAPKPDEAACAAEAETMKVNPY
ncbi:MAG: phosphatase PAP2 family protein [Phenylobacterium zucineum]|nr:MAG: phosphatase PAP2 family protein [Phenylobacterium zucineum]